MSKRENENANKNENETDFQRTTHKRKKLNIQEQQKSNSQPSSLMDIIPNEVIRMFLEYLSHKQRKGVARVSMIWNFLTNTFPKIPTFFNPSSIHSFHLHLFKNTYQFILKQQKTDHINSRRSFFQKEIVSVSLIILKEWQSMRRMEEFMFLKVTTIEFKC